MGLLFVESKHWPGISEETRKPLAILSPLSTLLFLQVERRAPGRERRAYTCAGVVRFPRFSNARTEGDPALRLLRSISSWSGTDAGELLRLLLTGLDHAVSCYNFSALVSFHSVKMTDMAKLIIEIHGTQTLTCDACHYQSIASIGKFCPQCHEQFTEVEYLSNHYRKKVHIERAATPSAAVKQKREP